MNQVAVVDLEASTHEDWEAAVQHVAAATSTAREAVWFRDTADGAFLFNAPFGEAQQPIAWISNRVQYQAAKSRGDLEDEESFLSRAGAPSLALHTTQSTMPSPSKKPDRESAYIVTHRLYWKGTRYQVDARIEPTTDEIATADFQAWIAHGWVRLEGEKAPTAPVHPPARKRGTKPVDSQTNLETSDGNFQLLDPRTIAPSPVNPRRHFDEEAMVEMTDSVREKGVRVAINVRPMPEGCWYLEPGRRSAGKRGMVEGWFLFDRRRFYMGKDSWGRPERKYHDLDYGLMENFFEDRAEAEAALPRWEIIAGERRWRAARRAGVGTIRAVVESMNDEEAAELQVIENDQRQDLSPLEAAAGYKHLLSLPGYSMEKLVQRVGKARNTLYGKLKLLELPEEAQQAVAAKRLQTQTAEMIGRLPEALQAEATQQILAGVRHGKDKGEALSTREAKVVLDKLKAAQTPPPVQPDLLPATPPPTTTVDAKTQAGYDRQAMMEDLDAITRQVERERSPRRALLAAVWAATGKRGDRNAVEFVAKRRAWISLKADPRETNSVVRSLASDLEVRELQALVVELAVAQLGDEESYFAASREEVRGLVEMESASGKESASARTFEPEEELQEALI